MIALPFAAHYGTSTQKFVTCFFLLFVFGFVNGVIQGQVFGTAGILPPQYMGIFMLGNGLSGIIMNLLRAFLQIVLPGQENEFTVALIFFILSAFILLMCAVAFSVLVNTEFFKYYKALSETGQQN